jgi:hypothetical protein
MGLKYSVSTSDRTVVDFGLTLNSVPSRGRRLLVSLKGPGNLPPPQELLRLSLRTDSLRIPATERELTEVQSAVVLVNWNVPD